MTSAGLPWSQRSAGEAQDLRRPARHGLDQGRERQLGAVDEAQAGGEHGLEPDGARARFGERQALAFHILRIVVGHDHVDEAGRQRRDQRGAIVFRPQRRAELEERAVGADVDFVQGEMVDGR